MFFASFTLAVGLVAIAGWLEWKERHGWAMERSAENGNRQLNVNKNAYRDEDFDPYLLLDQATQPDDSPPASDIENPYSPSSTEISPPETSIDEQYYASRRRARSRVHLIIASCGGLIMIGTVGGPTIWVVAWFLVMLALMLVIALALVDAYRTLRYHQAKLPEVRRQFLIED